MLRLWITLLLLVVLIGAVLAVLTRARPTQLRALGLGALCAGLIGGGLWWILVP